MINPADVIHTFWYGKANMCGCGDPTLVLTMIRDELAHYSIDMGARPVPPWTAERYLLAYALDAWELTSHASSLNWSGLTDEGKALLAAMQAVDLETALEDGSMLDGAV